MKDRFITIKGWMIDDLELSGVELLCYATIYNFSQPNDSGKTVGEWNGTQQEIADWIGCSQRQICNILNKLLEKNLIKISHEITKNGGEKTKCYIATAMKKFHSQLGKNFTASYEKISQPTSDYNKHIKKYLSTERDTTTPSSSVVNNKEKVLSEDTQPFGDGVIFDCKKKNSNEDRRAYAEATKVTKELAKIYGDERVAKRNAISKVKTLLNDYSKEELIHAMKMAMKDEKKRGFTFSGLLSNEMISCLVRESEKPKLTTMRSLY